MYTYVYINKPMYSKIAGKKEGRKEGRRMLSVLCHIKYTSISECYSNVTVVTDFFSP